MATNAPQDDWHKTGLRLPRELHVRLHEAAAASGRSYNGEIVARLEASLEPQNPLINHKGGTGFAFTMEELADKVAERVEVRLVAGGASPVRMGDIAAVLGPPPEETQHKAKVEEVATPPERPRRQVNRRRSP